MSDVFEAPKSLGTKNGGRRPSANTTLRLIG